LLPGVSVSNTMTAILVAVVLAFLNTVVKPILTILTIPVTVFTLGFFLLVINALMIILAAKLVDGFYVDGFWRALLFSLVLSLTTSILNMFAGTNEKDADE
jgi:putative membrane protein